MLGERDVWALTHGRAGGGFHELPDLTGATTRESVADLVGDAFKGAHPQKIANFTGQLWALRSRIIPGDVVVLPLKTTKQIAIGICSSGYEYLPDETEDRRHSIVVDWKTTDIAKSAIKDDLLNTLNGAMTIFRAEKNNAEARLRAVLETGVDPGASLSGPDQTPMAADLDSAEDVTDPFVAITPEAIRDRLRTHLTENFGGHKLTSLVGDLLTAEGYTCTVSPPGGDFGVDILAGRGPLGLDSPTLVVEVKSEAGKIGAGVVTGLLGAMNHQAADQALLVAWGGLTPQATTLLMTQRLKLAIWTDEDILDRLTENYERLPNVTRAAIPLKQAWVLQIETG